MRSKTAITALVIVLSCSVLANVFLSWRATKYYLDSQMVRLDPAGERKFGEEGCSLQEPGSGQSKIVLIGDSRIANWNPPPSPANCQIINRGVGAETTAQTILRLQRDAIDLKPQIIVVQAGINDLKNIGVFPKQKDEIVNSCWKNLNAIISQAREHNVHVVILTIFQSGPVGPLRRLIWSNEIPNSIGRVNEMMRNLKCDGVTVVDCDSILSANKTIKACYAQGTFHLNTAGYQALNDSIVPIIEKLLHNYDLSEN
jgi:lysophospholipase L1-like esterase